MVEVLDLLPYWETVHYMERMEERAIRKGAGWWATALLRHQRELLITAIDAANRVNSSVPAVRLDDGPAG